jgi:hypothetical protein
MWQAIETVPLKMPIMAVFDWGQKFYNSIKENTDTKSVTPRYSSESVALPVLDSALCP